MKVFVLSDLELFEAKIEDSKIKSMFVWNHSWIFVEDPDNTDRLWGYYFADNGKYRTWRDGYANQDVVFYDLDNLFLVNNAEDITKLLLQKEA